MQALVTKYPSLSGYTDSEGMSLLDTYLRLLVLTLRLNDTEKEITCYAQTANLLLSKGADKSRLDSSKLKYLLTGRQASYVVAKGLVDVLMLMLDLGLNPNDATDDGFTPLMVAANFGQTEIVKLLLSRGANPNITDKTNLAAIDFARNKSHFEVVRILEQYGAKSGKSNSRSSGESRTYKVTYVCTDGSGFTANKTGEMETTVNATGEVAARYQVETDKTLKKKCEDYAKSANWNWPAAGIKVKGVPSIVR